MFQYGLVLFVDGLLYLHGQQETHLVRLEISSPQRFKLKLRGTGTSFPSLKIK